MATETCKVKDPFQAAKEAEVAVLKLQSKVQHLKQRIQLSESEERAEIEERNKKIKENEKIIKNLEKEVEKLQISKTRGLQGDGKIIAKAFQKHSREIGILAGKSGKEAVEILDGKVLDLMKKSNALTHELKVKEKHLQKLKEQAKIVAWNNYNDFEREHAESETLRRVRELENEYQKIEKNLMECQIIQAKYKLIQEQLRRELSAYPSLLQQLEDDYRAQQADIEILIVSVEKAHKRRDIARKEFTKMEADALLARQEKEKILTEYSKVLKPKPTAAEKHFVELRDTAAAEKWRQLRVEQEAELKAFHEGFEKIKEAIGISDISDAEARFLSQKSTKEELTDLVKKTEEKIMDMKNEVQDLRSKNESLRGSELASPQVVLEEQLEKAKIEQDEQMERKASAEAELERIKKQSADIKSGLWYQLQLMEKYLREENEEVYVSPDITLKDIVSKIEQFLTRIFEELKNKDLDNLKAKLKEEQFMQKIQAMKLPSPAVAVKIKPAEEEESSDDEDLEKKRVLLKKEAQIYAEMKKKQQGRGRMMML